MDDRIGPVQASAVAAQQATLSWMTEKGMVKLRPKGSKLVTMLLCIDLIVSLGYIGPADRNTTSEVVALLFVKIAWFWILWFFWKGRNWARVLTMISAGTIFVLLFFPPKHTLVMQVYMVASSVFSAYLLYWLSTKPLVRFFKAPGNGISNPLSNL